jgi:response regulator of citrate/malate metabolism
MATAVPKNVSPLIRAGRWSLLIAGLAYGRVHHNTVKKREERVRQSEIDRVTQDAIDQLAEKKIKADQSMIDLAIAAGIDPNQARMKQLEAEAKSSKTAVQKTDADILPTGPADQSLQTSKKSGSSSKH